MMYHDPDPNALGHAQLIALGDVELRLGIERSAFNHGSDYHREPRGYASLTTRARGKVRFDRPLSADRLRDLSRTLAKYADVLDTWQTRDAIEAQHRAELAS